MRRLSSVMGQRWVKGLRLSPILWSTNWRNAPAPAAVILIFAGLRRRMGLSTIWGSPQGGTASSLRARDATGWQLNISGGSNGDNAIDRQGILYTRIDQLPWGPIQDPNGNRITPSNLLSCHDPISGMTWSVPSSVVDTIGLTIPLPPLSGGGGFGCGPTPITDYSGCTGSLPTNDAYLWSLPGISGGTYAIKVCYATVYLNTCYPYCRLSPQQFIQSLVLPNGTAWTFKYDSADPNNPNSIGWGDLTQLTFPTGGTISYGGWESVEMCGYLPAGRGLATRAIDAHDGTGP